MNFDSFTAPGDHAVVEHIKSTIYHAYNNAPRSLQEAPGPSELGEPCARRLAYKIMREPKLTKNDPLPSIVGTAAHSWLENACQMWNQHVGREDWLTEMELPIAPGITGHGDAYFSPLQICLDWKFPGTEPMREYRKNGPSQVYRNQIHLYGMGWRALGYPVDKVGIAFFSRGGNLEGRYGLHFWCEDYNPKIAEDALARYYAITELAMTLDVENHPENYKLFPASPDSCHHCPQRVEGSTIGRTCPGMPKPAKEKKTA
ncbi:hypothetical protein [Amycolatopsis kentuckyensis]|uniref:hypothetical protein n=1 Tax=Amycolatopsis kentuckyensis TaxID=218823 RepID=UPI000A3C573F|nr:hypothetical protein [Amycolatopsis kentuckyensis]